MKHIIMCGGKYSAWDIPRQMTVIDGETVIERTIRLLRAEGVQDIAISTNDERFKQFGVPILSHENDLEVYQEGCSGSWVSAFYPQQQPACYIFGDVVFSPAAIRKIVQTDTDSIMFFASAPPFSKEYIKPYAEPFAFKVKDQKRFRKAIEYVRKNERTGIFGRPPISWELWQVINGEPVREINYKNYIAINDYTCDIDNKKDVERIRMAIHEDNDPCLPGA